VAGAPIYPLFVFFFWSSSSSFWPCSLLSASPLLAAVAVARPGARTCHSKGIPEVFRGKFRSKMERSGMGLSSDIRPRTVKSSQGQERRGEERREREVYMLYITLLWGSGRLDETLRSLQVSFFFFLCFCFFFVLLVLFVIRASCSAWRSNGLFRSLSLFSFSLFHLTHFFLLSPLSSSKERSLPALYAHTHKEESIPLLL